jgi:hypothetical protein
LIPLAVFSVLMNLLTDVRPGSWAVADLVYGILVALCNGSGLYGIGKRGLALAGMAPSYSPELAVITAFIIALILLVFQVLLHAIRAVFAKIKHP